MPFRRRVVLTTMFAAALVSVFAGSSEAQKGKPTKGATAPKAPPKAPPKKPQVPPAKVTVPAEPADTKAAIDKPFRDFELRDIASEDGAMFKLSALKGKKAVVAVFMANRCGTTWTYEEKIGKLLNDYKDKEVQIVAIHSNYQEPDSEIVGQMEQRNLAMPVLDDKKTQALADYTETFSTPTFLIIDKEGILRYKGAFDRYGDDAHPYLRPALDSVLAGKKVATPTTRPFG